jgi:HTH-type transcriptional regulator/antitoxin HigA
MEIRAIKSRKQHRRYLTEAERLMAADPDPRSREGARLELLVLVIEAYEKAQFRFAMPDPIDAILFRMEQQGLKQKDIAPLMGGKNRASEVLARKRPLTLAMVRALHARLGIPSELLIQEPAAQYRVHRRSVRALRRTAIRR